MFVRTYAGALAGIDAVAVTVEVNITGGGLGLYLVGLPDNAVKESEQRIRAAFENSGERMSGKKVVVNLAPADLRKEGSGFDLPIAVGILAAMGRIDAEAVDGTMFIGELSLDGSVKPVRGVLPLAVRARAEGLRRLVLPAGNAAEAAVVEGIDAIGVTTLREVVACLNGEAEIVPAKPAAGESFGAETLRYAEDFADVKGQAHVKRALEIAAALPLSLDTTLLAQAALLHDIARTHADHAQLGAIWLEKLGYPTVAESIRQHHDLETPALDEASIVYIADKCLRGAARVPLAERFAASRKKCQSQEALAAWEKRWQTTRILQETINTYCGKELIQ